MPNTAWQGCSSGNECQYCHLCAPGIWAKECRDEGAALQRRFWLLAVRREETAAKGGLPSCEAVKREAAAGSSSAVFVSKAKRAFFGALAEMQRALTESVPSSGASAQSMPMPLN